MDNASWIAILIGVGGVIIGLIAIIYNNLNAKTTKNEDEIKDIKEKYVTKEDFNRTNDKIDAKLDKILDIVMGWGHEK